MVKSKSKFNKTQSIVQWGVAVNAVKEPT